MTPLDNRIKGLRAWAADRSEPVHAAVELLIEHGTWLRRHDFVERCVHRAEGGAVYVDWTEARAMLDDEDSGLVGSSTEIAVLDFAVDLARDRYRFTSMGRANAGLLVAAVTCALDRS